MHSTSLLGAAEGVPRAKFTKLHTFGRRPNFLKYKLRLRPNVKNTASVIPCMEGTAILN